MKRLMGTLTTTILAVVLVAFAGSETKLPKPRPTGATVSTVESDQWIIEGEKRYRANCGRCHQPPHKFPPREMATAIRHMRVRAMLTEEDAKYITFYMTH